jgi:hypothetical protein
MQGATQPKSNNPNCLGKAKFDCKYTEHVHLIDLASFILKKFFPSIGIPLRILCIMHDLQQLCANIYSANYCPSQLVYQILRFLHCVDTFITFF